MSAALNSAVTFPGVNAAADLTLEAPPAADVEIVIYGGFDPATEEAIENARRAAEILDKEYGVYAVVVPNTVYWQPFAPITITPFAYPVLVINGKEVSRGDVPRAEEIVEQALALLGLQGREEPAPLLGKKEGSVEEAVPAW